MKPLKLTATALAVVLASTVAEAAISISNWQINDVTRSISFNLEGTIDGAFGVNSTNLMYIGDKNFNGSWILDTSISSSYNIINDSSATANIRTTFMGKVSDSKGDYVLLFRDSGNFTIGDYINASIEMTGGAATQSGNVNFSDIIVSIGYNDNTILPDPSAQVGGSAIPAISEIPECSTFPILLAATSLLLVARRRQ